VKNPKKGVTVQVGWNIDLIVFIFFIPVHPVHPRRKKANDDVKALEQFAPKH